MLLKLLQPITFSVNKIIQKKTNNNIKRVNLRTYTHEISLRHESNLVVVQCCMYRFYCNVDKVFLNFYLFLFFSMYSHLLEESAIFSYKLFHLHNIFLVQTKAKPEAIYDIP